jgi:hypothetical protein
MRQTFSTISHKEYPEDDESIVATLILIKDNDKIQIRITKETGEIQNNEVQITSKEILDLGDVNVKTLSTIRERTNTWIQSESKAAIFEEFDDVEGEYERISYTQNTGRGFSNTSSKVVEGKSESSFDEIRFSIAEEGISFDFPEDGGHGSVWIPSADELEYGPKNISNADLFNKTLFNFFQLRFPNEILSDASKLASPEDDAISYVERIFDRFGAVVRQLDERQRDREPLLVKDEYDVQYILQALLKINFDDVRTESHTEQHSTVNPRVDFLLETNKIGIEVKLASESMNKKRILKDLAKDKEQYRNSSKIETLLCFIYDPDYIIKNPAELESDLSGSRDNLKTTVTVTH